MTYTLYVGDYAYSSWSLRGWLMLDAFGIDHRMTRVPMYSEAFTAMQDAHAPARTVPALRIGEGEGSFLVWESLAIAETLAERHPEAGLWPGDSAARGVARALASEMHSGFAALRRACPMNLRRRYSGFEVTAEIAADVARLETIWGWAIAQFGGPYLGGAAFSAVDAMFAPVATRLVSYGIATSPVMRGYVEAIYAVPSFRRWHAMADADPRVLSHYDKELPELTNAGPPRPVPLDAARYEGDVAEAINVACPFSGNPVKAEGLAKIDGQIIGMCNPFCRDKSVADAESWPQVMAMLRG